MSENKYRKGDENLPDKPKIPLPEHIKKFRASLPKPNDRQEVRQLPTWAKNACTKHELCGASWRTIAVEIKKNQRTVEIYCRSPAAKKFRKALVDIAGDPLQAARFAHLSVAGYLAVENLQHYEAAKAAGDLTEAGKQLRFMTESIGMPEKKPEDTRPTVTVINFPGATITAELPMGESSSEKIETIQAEVIDE